MTATSVEQVNGTPVASELRVDPVRVAEAEAIRARAAAERQALLTAAEGEKALKEQQAEQLRLENEKQALANDRAAVRFEREKAEQRAKTAEAKAKQEATERAARADREAEDARRAQEKQQAAEVAGAEDRWRSYALRFYIVCAIVALPVQIAAFYNPKALWLMAAPLMLEGGAWVVLKGAAAAVASNRPHWHYRLIAWLIAFIAAAINLWHGLHAFDAATAIGTAFASIAGPGVWDLHEHGRIRKRDGVLTRGERKAQEKAAKEEAKQKAAEEKRCAAEKEAAAKAAAEKAAQLTELRKKHFQKVWEHAEKLAADIGEVDPNAVWERAKLDVEGAKPGESAEVLRMRNAATARVEAARQQRPVNTLSKTTNAQRAIQTPRSGYKPVPPRRTKGDTPRYSRAAGRAHSELLRTKNAAKKDPS